MVNRGTTQQSSAPYYKRLVLDMIRRHGSLSRKELVHSFALSPQTVANITGDLEAVGLIVSRRLKSPRSRGQPPLLLELNPHGGNSLGIAIEPGRVCAALVNPLGEVLQQQGLETDTRERRHALTLTIELVKELLARCRFAQPPWGIGVALPGPFAAGGESAGWGDPAVLDELRRSLGLPVFHSLDSAAGALGEALFGAGRGVDNFFYMHFGASLGGALMINRVAFHGASGNAGGIGHVPVVPDGEPCQCGSRGCLERYFSLDSLAEALGHSEPSRGACLQLEQLLDEREPRLIEWCRQAAAHLRMALRTVEALFDPEAIVIGGTAPKALLEHLAQLAEPAQRPLRPGLAQHRVRIGEREQSAVLGAAMLPIHELLAPRYEVLLQERREQLRADGLPGRRAAGSL